MIGPVKELALENNIPLLQPASLKDPGVQADIRELNPDLIIVVAYGMLLPQAVLDIPAHGCVNVHASLLPRWRGAAPIQAAILAGDTRSGVSLMRMEAGLDCGPVYASSALDIADYETAGQLHDRLAELGGHLLLGSLSGIIDGSTDAIPQDGKRATYAGKIDKQDARIDWSQPAASQVLKVRAYNPVPGAWFELNDERIKVWAAEALNEGGAPGEVMAAGPEGIDIACAEGGLRMTELQRPGRGRVTARELSAQIDLCGPARHE